MCERSAKEKLNCEVVDEIRTLLDLSNKLFVDVSKLQDETDSWLEIHFMRVLTDMDKKLIEYREQFKNRSDL